MKINNDNINADNQQLNSAGNIVNQVIDSEE